jgi:hypothetical protein
VRHSGKYGSGLSWHWTILTKFTVKGSVSLFLSPYFF